MFDRSVKITFAEMRASGVRGLLVYFSNYLCSHSIAISADDGQMTCGFPISSHGSCARPAASAAPTKWNVQIPIGGRGYR